MKKVIQTLKENPSALIWATPMGCDVLLNGKSILDVPYKTFKKLHDRKIIQGE